MERMEKPKFIKEIEKLEGKERAKCGRWYIRVYGELDHKPMVELESLEIVVKELHKLEEENKKLNIKVASLEGEIKGLNSVIDKLHKEIEEQEAEGGGLFDEIDYRKRECKKLKEEIRFLEQCLDNKEKVNKSLREELEKLKSTYVYDAKQVRDIC